MQKAESHGIKSGLKPLGLERHWLHRSPARSTRGAQAEARGAYGAARRRRVCCAKLSAVHPQVPRQAALVARAVGAVLAGIRLLSSVHSQVYRQRTLDARAERSMLEGMRLLSRVHPQVYRQGCPCRSCGRSSDRRRTASLQSALADAPSGRPCVQL